MFTSGGCFGYESQTHSGGRRTQPREFIIKLINMQLKSKKVLITGLPGSGKTFVSLCLPNVTHLDDFAKLDSSEKWVSDPPRNRAFYEGTSENIIELVHALKITTVIYVRRDPVLIRQTAKADSIRADLDAPVRKFFKWLSVQSNHTIRTMEAREIRDFGRFCKVFELKNPD